MAKKKAARETAVHSPSAPAPADGNAIPIISEDQGPSPQEAQPATLEQLKQHRIDLRSQLADIKREGGELKKWAMKQRIQAVDADIAAIETHKR